MFQVASASFLAELPELPEPPRLDPNDFSMPELPALSAPKAVPKPKQDGEDMDFTEEGQEVLTVSFPCQLFLHCVPIYSYLLSCVQ